VSRRWIDISVPLRPGMPVWPGDPPMSIERLSAIAAGAAANVSAVSMCLHTGTHVDAPLHFLDGAPSIAEMPLDALVGPARVVAIGDSKTIRGLRHGERILFKTRGDQTHLAPDAAALLVDRGVRAVGIDRLSIGAPNEEGDHVHHLLLGAGIWIVEGLDLAAVPPGRYDLICLPLRVPGADGAPARAILRPRPSSNRPSRPRPGPS
jgi:arylformamidase